jgi:hypothetical protein
MKKESAGPGRGPGGTSGALPNVLIGTDPISAFPLARAERLPDGTLFVPSCPYCGRPHWHGRGEGWRWSHCIKSSGPYYLTLEAKP